MLLITGPPGIGKTTLIKKLSNYLSTMNVNCTGFYTEEVRSNNSRIGFDVVTLEGLRGTLARKGTSHSNRPRVGQYEVFLEDFEKLVLPVLEKSCDVLIIDEIGKMELFSKKFEETIKKLMQQKKSQVVATVPVKSLPGIVESLKKDENNQLITVSHSNRDDLLETLIKLLKVE